MGDKTSSRHGNRAVGIEFSAGAYPPGTGDDRDEPIIRMIMRMAHVMRVPLGQDNVLTRLVRIPAQNRTRRAASSLDPRNLVR